MKITKLGHCCLLIEEAGARIMTDPGMFPVLQNDVKDVDIILITHEHQDHFHLESLKIVLQNNPKAQIFTNSGVGALLEKEGIAFELLADGDSQVVQGILIEGFGTTHATIYEEYGKVANTGYFIANRFFYPGDAFYDPKKPVEILALPVSGPWVKIADAVEYAKMLKPKICFPVHDGMLKFTAPTFFTTSADWGREVVAGKSLDLVATFEKSMFKSFPELRLRIVDIV